ncbi:MAG: hypothetical protein IJX71_07135 [Oscillospiraceae bacterium]|nr:hypothetical protein [Oscillospiraceae bacterium]
MDIEFTYDPAIVGVELPVNGEFTGNRDLKVTLTGHRAYHCSAGYPDWSYDWFFACSYKKQRCILKYNSCSQGQGWFLMEAPKVEMKQKRPVSLYDFRFPERGRWSSVDLLAEHTVIDELLGDRPRHCRGY